MPYLEVTASKTVCGSPCSFIGANVRGTAATTVATFYDTNTSATASTRIFLQLGAGTASDSYSPSSDLPLSQGIYVVIAGGTAYVHYK